MLMEEPGEQCTVVFAKMVTETASECVCGGGALIKNKIKFSSYIGKFRMEHLQSHMRGRALIYEEMRKYLIIYEEAVSHI
jgi:hypothetical protein